MRYITNAFMERMYFSCVLDCAHSLDECKKKILAYECRLEEKPSSNSNETKGAKQP